MKADRKTDKKSFCLFLTDILKMSRSLLNIVPPGMIVSYSGNVIPYNWILCDGRSISQKDYNRLYGVIGKNYGGSKNNFQVPNLTNMFVRCLGTDTASLGSIQDENFEQHSHGISMKEAGGHVHSLQTNINGFDVQGILTGNIEEHDPGPGGNRNRPAFTDFNNKDAEDPPYLDFIRTDQAGAHNHEIIVKSEGDSETRPQNMALYFIIKF